MKRRDFLAGLGAGAFISTVDWLRWFNRNGVPGTAKTWGLAEAHAQAAATYQYLIYWYQEGGWDGYSMFNPIDTRNDATLTIPNGTLTPSPDWASQIYRPKGYDATKAGALYGPAKTSGNINYGYLADDGASLLPDMAVISSCYGNEFHSGGRFDSHYGIYPNNMAAYRDQSERTVMQAFAEAYGASYLLANVSWHLWLSDGELSVTSYPEGTGYYDKLGPAYAHTQYAQTPDAMSNQLKAISQLAGNARDEKIRSFIDNINTNFIADKNSESVKAFSSALQIYKAQVSQGVAVDPNSMFTDATLLEEFAVAGDDQQSTSTSVNNNPARSKNSPNTNVQALMTYEMMTKGLSYAFWIESRQIRGFDTHNNRVNVLNSQGQTDQKGMMKSNLWTPLATLAGKMKSTALPDGSGRSYWDVSTIVIASEMGRIMGQVDAEPLREDGSGAANQYTEIMNQDVCQHWHISSTAFMGGTVQGNSQWGKVGTDGNQLSIPLMPDGSLDPNYDHVLGTLLSGKTKDPDEQGAGRAGSVYATALYCSGLDPDNLRANNQGKNQSPPLKYVKKGG